MSDEDLPAVIPQVTFDKHGEPMIAREMVVKPSPIPRSLSIILVILAAISVGINSWGQAQRNEDNKRQNAINEAQDRKQSEAIEANRQLIIGLLQAKTPQERKKLLEDFVADLAPSPSPQPGPHPTSMATVIIIPAPTPSRTTSPRRTPSAKPKPRPSARPSATRKPSPKPTPSPSPTCRLPRPNPLIPCL